MAKKAMNPTIMTTKTTKASSGGTKPGLLMSDGYY
jgi:hypothetical protein